MFLYITFGLFVTLPIFIAFLNYRKEKQSGKKPSDEEIKQFISKQTGIPVEQMKEQKGFDKGTSAANLPYGLLGVDPHPVTITSFLSAVLFIALIIDVFAVLVLGLWQSILFIVIYFINFYIYFGSYNSNKLLPYKDWKFLIYMLIGLFIVYLLFIYGK